MSIMTMTMMTLTMMLKEIANSRASSTLIDYQKLEEHLHKSRVFGTMDNGKAESENSKTEGLKGSS